MRTRVQQVRCWETFPSRASTRWGWLAVGIVLLSWTLSAADSRIRHFRAGALIGANIDAEFSQSGLFDALGALGDFSNGWEFDDGFVRPDGSESGYTSNWGYNNAAQYNAAANGGDGALTFSRTSAFEATDSSSANSDPHLGLDLAYGGTLKRIRKTWILWELGFSLLPINVRSGSTADATITQNTYEFNTGGIIVPEAPYTGGPDSGPLLSTAQPPVSSSPGTPGTLSATREIDAMLYNLRLGPQIHHDLTRHWSVELMGGFALGLVDGSYDYSERLLSSTGESVVQGSLAQTDWLYGGYAGVLTQVHFERNAYLYGSAQWMSLGNVGFSEGGRSAELQLDQGLYFSVGFTWLF